MFLNQGAPKAKITGTSISPTGAQMYSSISSGGGCMGAVTAAECHGNNSSPKMSRTFVSGS